MSKNDQATSTTGDENEMTEQIEIRTIAPHETLPLRSEVLRPGQPAEASVFAGDEDAAAQHWGAFAGGNLIAVASLYPEPLPEVVSLELLQHAVPPSALISGEKLPEYTRYWRLRGMAVRFAFQGRGYGRQLLHHCLRSVASHGGRWLWCNARASAVGFYRGTGFQIVSHEFFIPEIGPHYVMLRLASSSSS